MEAQQVGGQATALRAPAARMRPRRRCRLAETRPWRAGHPGRRRRCGRQGGARGRQGRRRHEQGAHAAAPAGLWLGRLVRAALQQPLCARGASTATGSPREGSARAAAVCLVCAARVSGLPRNAADCSTCVRRPPTSWQPTQSRRPTSCPRRSSRRPSRSQSRRSPTQTRPSSCCATTRAGRPRRGPSVLRRWALSGSRVWLEATLGQVMAGLHALGPCCTCTETHTCGRSWCAAPGVFYLETYLDRGAAP